MSAKREHGEAGTPPPAFFVLHQDVARTTELAEVEPVGLGPAPSCPRCGAFVGLKPWLPPFTADLRAVGGEWGDLAWGAGNELLASERFVEIWRRAGLTGLEPFSPVAVRRAKPRRPAPPRYLHTRVLRSRAAVDERHSRLVRKEPPRCEVCRTSDLQAVYGVRIEDGSWGGEDLLVARGLPGFILASRRFHDLVRENRLAQIDLTPAESFVFTFGLAPAEPAGRS